MKVKKSGYVLVLTLLLLSISILVITRLVTPTVARYQQSNLFIRQEKARQLALSGIQLVLSYLNEPRQKDTASKEAKGSENTKDEKKILLFTHIFEMLNHWQTISLHEQRDGVEGSIEVYVSNEAGKININGLYDFEKKQWRKQGPFEAIKIVQWLSDHLKDQIGNINLAEVLENFF